MRLALLGHPIAHSLSPSIYRNLLGDELKSYQLLDIPEASAVPSLTSLSLQLDGLSITAPYKKHFFEEVKIESASVRKIGAINTISFRPEGFFATNTDLVATEKILKRFKARHENIQLILLGNGSMAKMTLLLAEEIGLPILQLSRDQGINLSEADLSVFHEDNIQTIVINSCSRSFIFNGILHPDFIFWDYNYNFESHQQTIPSLVSSYQDGKEMLELQAQAALAFWKGNKP